MRNLGWPVLVYAETKLFLWWSFSILQKEIMVKLSYTQVQESFLEELYYLQVQK